MDAPIENVLSFLRGSERFFLQCETPSRSCPIRLMLLQLRYNTVVRNRINYVMIIFEGIEYVVYFRGVFHVDFLQSRSAILKGVVIP